MHGKVTFLKIWLIINFAQTTSFGGQKLPQIFNAITPTILKRWLHLLKRSFRFPYSLLAWSWYLFCILIFHYIFKYVTTLFKALCLILLSSYTSLYVSPLILDYVNKWDRLHWSLYMYVEFSFQGLVRHYRPELEQRMKNFADKKTASN